MSNEPKQDAQPHSEIDAAAMVDDNQMLNSDLNGSLSSETTVDASSNTAELQDDAAVAALEARIKQLEDSLKLEKARTANAIYDTEKVKERLNREADTAKKFALEKFAKDLLNSVDNLERAIQASGDESSALLDGVKLTHKSLLNTLEKFEVKVVDTQSGFNAELHQAVGIDPNTKAGEIANVLQQGYTLEGRLLRPAMVMVGQ